MIPSLGSRSTTKAAFRAFNNASEPVIETAHCLVPVTPLQDSLKREYLLKSTTDDVQDQNKKNL